MFDWEKSSGNRNGIADETANRMMIWKEGKACV